MAGSQIAPRQCRSRGNHEHLSTPGPGGATPVANGGRLTKRSALAHARIRRSGRLAIVRLARVACVVAVAGCRHDVSADAAAFVGAAACAKCHSAEFATWRKSQHALAMQSATPASVEGRFDSARVTIENVTSTFLRRGDRFVVNTDGEDGALHDYPVTWTFGVNPLQQYLVRLSGGRVQALTLAWDARPRAQGGQRWFSLAPGHGAAPQNALHWTGRQYNWNYMCADCHSTAVRKNYDDSTRQFHTTFAEVNVSCEACHGPGSRHVSWARRPSWLRGDDDGLPNRLVERRDVRWQWDSASGRPRRSRPRTTDREIETCAQCHSRRVHVADGYTAGKPLMDYYIPALITPGLYYADGQQLDEVYDYGSFLQSRMYAAGVTCSDCHDPHSGKLRQPGNQVCTQCHLASRYDAPAHHHHAVNGPGAQCASCHMPTRTYMQIDARHDHSIRIPRPDLSASIGTPNACNECHVDRSAQWAADQVRTWYPRPDLGFQRFATAFDADERNVPGASDSLGRIANDSTQPWFVRASALARLGRYSDDVAAQAARAWIADPHPLVRLAALQILENFGAGERIRIGAARLSDSVRAVRQGAAYLLAPVADSLDPSMRRAFDSAAAEFVASQRYNADQPGDRLALGVFYAQRNQLDSAQAEFEAALRLDPGLEQAARALEAVRRARGAGSRDR